MSPAPLPTPAPTPTLVDLVGRQAVITTVSVTASDSATAAASTKAAIPIAPIVGGLVGGILGGLLIAGIVYWCYVKKNKERDARHRAAVARRNRKRQAAVAAQEAKAKAQTAKEVFEKSNTEKYAAHAAAAAAALPVVPMASYNPNQKPEHGYGYSNETPDYAAEYLAAVEEPDDEPVYETQPSYEPQPELAPVVSTSEKTRPSRSKARMAAAENAVANASAPVDARYRPNKPSPLAAAKLEEERLASIRNGNSNGNGGPGYGDAYNNQSNGYNSNHQETLGVPGETYYQPDQSNLVRKPSGEWGVALGSPTGDGSFSQQQSMHQHESPFHYDQNDPYLPSAGAYQYEDARNDMAYHDAAASAGMGAPKKGGSWV